MRSNSSVKMSITLTGLQKDIVDCIPEGKKGFLINQVILDSFLTKSLNHSLLISLGSNEYRKIQRKIAKIMKGMPDTDIVVGKSSQLEPESVDNDELEEENLFFEEKKSPNVLPKPIKFDSKDEGFGFFNEDK